MTDNGLKPFNAGDHIIFINGRWKGDDLIGHLMEDFSTADPCKIKNEVLSEMLSFFKTTLAGRSEMKESFEELLRKRDKLRDKKRDQQWRAKTEKIAIESRQEGRQEERLGIAVRMRNSKKYPIEVIKDILNLSDSEVLRLSKLPA